MLNAETIDGKFILNYFGNQSFNMDAQYGIFSANTN